MGITVNHYKIQDRGKFYYDKLKFICFIYNRDSPNHGNSVNIMAKVEDLVVKKIGEFKEIFALEIKKNLGSNLGSPNLSEEEKK